MEFHKIAGIFPLIHGPEFNQLIDDIKLNGLIEPILTYEGQILDGRNRYNACKQAGVEPHFVEYEGDDPVGHVISLNLYRRHLESDQRAASAVDALPRYEEEAKKRQGTRTDLATDIPQKIAESKESRQHVAEQFHTNRQYVSDMKKLKEEEPETFEDIKEGRQKLSQVKKEKKRKERIEKIAEISEGNASLPEGKTYPVIYADPPWRYEYSETESRSIENQYPTMDLEAICALKVPAQEDAILFLWTTSPKLDQGIRVLQEWGFTYRTCAIWDKQKIGMGYYFRQQHEILLVGVRGNLPVPEAKNRPKSVFSFPRGEHSAKPAEVAEMIERMYPELSKLEMFCRSPRDGWDVWGNQSVGA